MYGILFSCLRALVDSVGYRAMDKERHVWGLFCGGSWGEFLTFRNFTLSTGGQGNEGRGCKLFGSVLNSSLFSRIRGGMGTCGSSRTGGSGRVGVTGLTSNRCADGGGFASLRARGRGVTSRLDTTGGIVRSLEGTAGASRSLRGGIATCRSGVRALGRRLGMAGARGTLGFTLIRTNTTRTLFYLRCQTGGYGVVSIVVVREKTDHTRHTFQRWQGLLFS